MWALTVLLVDASNKEVAILTPFAFCFTVVHRPSSSLINPCFTAVSFGHFSSSQKAVDFIWSSGPSQVSWMSRLVPMASSLKKDWITDNALHPHAAREVTTYNGFRNVLFHHSKHYHRRRSETKLQHSSEVPCFRELTPFEYLLDSF